MRQLTVLLLIALLLTSTATSAQTTPPPQPTSVGFWGMNTYFSGYERITRDGESGIAQLVAEGRALGVEWAREELSWANFQPNRSDRFDWEYFDRRLLEAAEAGYGIVGMLLTTPGWARVSDCAERVASRAARGIFTQAFWCPPADMQQWATFVGQIVERYDGDGQADAPGSPRVAVWQIGNEPNAQETWPGTPAEYAAYLRAAYPAVKAADPSAIVALGGVYVFDGATGNGAGAEDGIAFLQAVFTADPAAWNAFDIVAIHPYMPTAAPDQPGLFSTISLWGRIQTTISWIAARQAQFGGFFKPIWISEVGWSTCLTSASDCTPPEVARSESEQASFMVRTHLLAKAAGVSHVSYFQLEDKFDGSYPNFWEEAAILAPTSEGYRRKLAANAYATMTNLIGASAFAGFGTLNQFVYQPGVLLPAGRTHLRFRRPGRTIDVLWSTAAATTVRLPLEPGAYALIGRDGTAAPLAVDRGQLVFTVGAEPVYLVREQYQELWLPLINE